MDDHGQHTGDSAGTWAEHGDAGLAQRRIVEASVTLRQALECDEASGRSIVELLEQDIPVHDVVLRTRPVHLEQCGDVDALLEEYLDRRRRFRLLSVEALLHDGMSMGRIASVFGVSRQRISQLAAQISKDRPDPTPPVDSP